jgi:hypothetical protein
LSQHPITTIHEYILTEIRNARLWTVKPGPQFADDPENLLRIMQRTLVQFQNVSLPQQNVDQLYSLFVMEGQQFYETWTNGGRYLRHDAYKEVNANIKAMLDRMKIRST